MLEATVRELLTDLILCRQIPGLAEKKKKHTHISLSNQLFPLLFFVSCSDKSCCSRHCLLQLLAGPQGPHRGNGIIWAHITTCVSITGATWRQCYRLVCSPLYFVTRGYCVRAKRLWDPLMKSTCSPESWGHQISLLCRIKTWPFRRHSSAQTQSYGCHSFWGVWLANCFCRLNSINTAHQENHIEIILRGSICVCVCA